MNASNIAPIVNGGMTWWDVGPTSHELLHERLRDIGLAQYCPPPRSVNQSLKKSLGDYAASARKLLVNNGKKRDMIVQRLKSRRDGFEVAEVARDHDKNDYKPRFSAKIEQTQGGDCESVIVTSGYASDLYDIQTNYRVCRQQVTGSDVGKALVGVLGHYHGTCVRTIGGVYYVPEDNVDDWDAVVHAIESAGPNTVNRIRVVWDEQAIQTVKRAITKELIDKAARITEEIRDGELNDEALARRKQQAQALRTRAAEYEGILQSELAECHSMISLAETAAASGQAMQDDSKVFDSMY